MSDALSVVTFDTEDFKWVWDAHAYNHVTPLSAAGTRLSIFRQHILLGGTVHLKTHEQDLLFETVTRFDDWVFTNFPDCLSLYPKTKVISVAELRMQNEKKKEQDTAQKNLLQTLRDANFR